jgi:hypothetical protein
MADGAKREPAANAAESETLSMRGNSLREKREIPRVPPGGAAGRPGKVYDRTSGTYARVTGLTAETLSIAATCFQYHEYDRRTGLKIRCSAGGPVRA